MIKGIIFDKDGTLIEFNRLWIDATNEILQKVVTEYQQEEKLEELMCKIGIEKGVVREDSVLAGKTSQDMAEIISQTLNVDYQAILKQLNEFYYMKTVENPGNIQPLCNLPQVFKKLKIQNIKIGIVTADNYDVTKFILEKLDILQYVDFIGAADLYKRKPHPEALLTFCEQENLQANEVIHIGDTSVDMDFSKHCLHGVGVLTGVGSKELLSGQTPYVLNDVSEVIEFINNYNLSIA